MILMMMAIFVGDDVLDDDDDVGDDVLDDDDDAADTIMGARMPQVELANLRQQFRQCNFLTLCWGSPVDGDDEDLTKIYGDDSDNDDYGDNGESDDVDGDDEIL